MSTFTIVATYHRFYLDASYTSPCHVPVHCLLSVSMLYSSVRFILLVTVFSRFLCFTFPSFAEEEYENNSEDEDDNCNTSAYDMRNAALLTTSTISGHMMASLVIAVFATFLCTVYTIERFFTICTNKTIF